MGDCWQTIEGDGHVISLNDYSTLKVSKYRDEIREQFQSIALALLSQATQQISLAKGAQSQTVLMQFQQVNWLGNPPEGIDCEILFLGEENWQKGKLRIKVAIDFSEYLSRYKAKDLVEVKEGIDREETPNTDFIVSILLEFLRNNSIEEQNIIPEENLEIKVDRPTVSIPANPHLFTFKSDSI